MTADSPNGPLLEAVDAAVGSERAGQPRITGVNWRVMPGEFWVFGGAHGSGKSALLNTVAGLRRPAGGIVRHFGHDLASLSEGELLRLRTRIGFVFKSGGRMFGELSVAGNVALPLRYHRNWSEEEAEPEVAAMLKATGLDAMARQNADSLGSGWQHRVGLARALILQPEILFLDEPLAGLDSQERRWWREFLTGLTQGAPPANGRKIAVMAATNDFSLWSGARHHFGVIRDGRWNTLSAGTEPPELH